MIAGSSSLAQMPTQLVELAVKREATLAIALVSFLPVKLFCLPPCYHLSWGKGSREPLTWEEVGPIACIVYLADLWSKNAGNFICIYDLYRSRFLF